MSILLARDASTLQWLKDLKSMLTNAKYRFFDVVWEDEENNLHFAHKFIIYSRSTGAFQQKYLGAPQARISLGGGETHSLYTVDEAARSLTRQSVYSDSTTVPYTNRESPLSLGGTDSALFSDCLEFLYTGTQEMQAVFVMLFEGFESDQKETVAKVDGGRDTGGTSQLRADLLYTWRARLFVDCRITLDDPEDDEKTPTSFEFHRSILASRSPYFHALLLGGYSDSRQKDFTLPSPPFTPASTSFILGWIYTGTLDFNQRNYDLSTAFQIWRGAAYLSLALLQSEVEIEIELMMNPDRATRIYQFAIASDVSSVPLARVSLECIANEFGKLWVDSIIGNFDRQERNGLVEAVMRRITPKIVTDIIKKCFAIRKKIELERAEWAANIREMVETMEDRARKVLGDDLGTVLVSPAFVGLIDGIGFSTDVLEFMLELVTGSLNEKNAPMIYQALVGLIELREEGILMDAKMLVADSKKVILKYIKARWLSIRATRGFEGLEAWCLKELSDGKSS